MVTRSVVASVSAVAAAARVRVLTSDRVIDMLCSAGAWAVLATVPDPEVPALSVRDLGIVREVALTDPSSPLEIVLTPTYSGCPATEVIEQSVLEAIDGAGLGPARVQLQRAPAWTSDWISAEGRRKMLEYGIAPPGPVAGECESSVSIISVNTNAVNQITKSATWYDRILKPNNLRKPHT